MKPRDCQQMRQARIAKPVIDIFADEPSFANKQRRRNRARRFRHQIDEMRGKSSAVSCQRHRHVMHDRSGMVIRHDCDLCDNIATCQHVIHPRSPPIIRRAMQNTVRRRIQPCPHDNCPAKILLILPFVRCDTNNAACW